MSRLPIRVFLIEDNPGDAHLVERYLAAAEGEGFRLETADRVAAGIERIVSDEPDVLLLDLNLPDSQGLETFRRVYSRVPELPLIVMTGQDDRALALEAVRDGAQDYLVKHEVDTELLVRAIHYAIERKRFAEELRESQERFALAVSGANDGVWDWDLRSDEIYFSPRWKEMLAYDDDEVGNRPDDWFSRVHPADVDGLKKDISLHLSGSTDHFDNEHRLLHRSGGFRWMLVRGQAVRDAGGNAYRIAGSLTDIDERKTTEQQLLHDAMHDPLTKLPNSALLMDRLGMALAQAERRRDHRFALLYFDLDRFKAVNDSLGHAIGDQLLIKVALRLQTLLRPGDTVARQGGDEFAILANGMEKPSDATRIAERIHEELRRPFNLEGHEVSTSASIGITHSSGGYSQAEDLLRDADTAMYRAKSLGKAQHAIYDEEMHRHAVELLKLETELRRGLDANEFRLHYQPIVSLETGELEGFEALMRWQHPRRGLIYPKDFMQVAEETGLIVPIGWSVLREACGQMATWHRQFPLLRVLSVSVNLSSRQFARPDLIERIAQVLEGTGLEPGKLMIEITEQLIMENSDKALGKLGQLRDMGVKVHIDDFGTGFSSLSYLQRLPAHTLKIDRSLVGEMGETDEKAKVVETIVALARRLGMGVSAEGLETQAQLTKLQGLDCELAQGYYFSRPLDSEEARELIASRPRW